MLTKSLVKVLFAAIVCINFQPLPANAATGPAVTEVKVTAEGLESGQLRVSWKNPSFTSAQLNDFASYLVKIYSDNGAEFARSNLTTGTDIDSPNVVFEGLTNGNDYSASVTILYSADTPTEIKSDTSAKPFDVPAKPAAPTAIRTSAGEVTLNWLQPNSNGSAISGYTILCTPSCPSAHSTSTIDDVDPLSKKITGLNVSTSYTFKIKATNARGDSQESLSSSAITPHDVVIPPDGVATVKGDKKLSANWIAPAIKGAIITKYVVELIDADTSVVIQTKDVTSPSVEFTGLINGKTYFVSVKTVVGTIRSSAINSLSTTPEAVVIPPVVEPPAAPAAPAPAAPAPAAPAPVAAPAPAAPSGPAPMTKGSKPTLASVAQNIGMSVPPKSKVTVVVSKASKKNCKTQGSKLVGTASGLCTVTVTVRAPKPAPVTTAGSVTSGKGTLSSAQVAAQTGINVPAKSKVSFTIDKASRKVCSASGTKLRFKTAGTCSFKMKVQAPQPGPVKQTSTITVN